MLSIIFGVLREISESSQEFSLDFNRITGGGSHVKTATNSFIIIVHAISAAAFICIDDSDSDEELVTSTWDR